MVHLAEQLAIFLFVFAILAIVIAGFVAASVLAMRGSLYSERGDENVAGGPVPFDLAWPEEDD